MTSWSARERRWRDALLFALVPAHARGPGLSPLELDDFWQEATRAAPPLLHLGLRLAVWALTLSPPLLMGRAALFGGLTPDEQDALLRRAHASRVFLLRQLVNTLKLMAAFAYLSDAGVRTALDGDAP